MKNPLILLLFVISSSGFSQCFTSIVSENHTMLGRGTDGSLFARGLNQNGATGNGNGNFTFEFIQVGDDSDWTDKLSINRSRAFAIKQDGTLWVWGRTYTDGAEGLGVFYPDANTVLTPTLVGTDNNWVEITSHETFTLGIKSDGSLWSWGSNLGAGLGTGADASFKTNTPIRVGTENDWLKVCNSNGSSIAIKTDHTLWSWGGSANGNNATIGYPNSDVNNAYRTPHQIGTDSNWVDVSTASHIAFAFKSDGTLWAWGSTYYGLFANGIYNDTSVVPIQIGSDTDWQSVSVSQYTVAALKTNRTRWGWGYQTSRQLGMEIGFSVHVNFPTLLDYGTDWTYISNDKTWGYLDMIKQNNSLYHSGQIYPSTIYQTPTVLGSPCALAVDTFAGVSFVSFAPNPTEDLLTIRYDLHNHTPVVVEIANALGQIVSNKQTVGTIGNNQQTITMGNLPSGIYFISLQTDTDSAKIKIIKN